MNIFHINKSNIRKKKMGHLTEALFLHLVNEYVTNLRFPHCDIFTVK